jgi:hypothetical protein
MRTVDLIQRKRDGEELSPEEIEFLVNGYTTGDIPDYQMSAFLMAVFYSGMSDRELSRLTECMLHSGDSVDLSGIPGVKVDKHSTGGVRQDQPLLRLAAAAGVIVPMMSSAPLGTPAERWTNWNPFQDCVRISRSRIPQPTRRDQARVYRQTEQRWRRRTARSTRCAMLRRRWNPCPDRLFDHVKKLAEGPALVLDVRWAAARMKAGGCAAAGRDREASGAA